MQESIPITPTKILDTHYRIPKRGDVVLGQVVSVGDRIATIELSGIIWKKNEELFFSPIGERAHAYIFRGDVNYPCTSLTEILKVGDLVLGTIKIDWFVPFFISFDSQVLGVVSGVCNKCGVILPTPKNFDKLICPHCKNIRNTKISPLYNPIIWRELHFRFRVKMESSI